MIVAYVKYYIYLCKINENPKNRLQIRLNMKDRIRQLMEAQRMTQQTFAQFVEISPATLSSIFTGRTKPTLNLVEAIIKKIPSVNLDWLMFGKGSMFADEGSDAHQESSGSTSATELQFDFDTDLHTRPATYSTPTAVKPKVDSTKVSHSERYVVSERVVRKITEIRVFFDDQTYESFVPKNK